MDRYIDNGDGTVTDVETGLMWQQADDGRKRTWQKASDYANRCLLAGHRNWRVPTYHELVGLVNIERYQPAISPIFKCHSDNYWSSSTFVNFPDNAWYVYFFSGRVYWYYKYSSYYVRCVRVATGEVCYVA